MPTHAAATRDIQGSSPAMAALRDFITRSGAVDAPVLLTGETGTGKSLAARAIHQASVRAPGPFLVVNCAGIPETLFESELFGHEKGAFTGAARARTGLLEAAGGGTLFLDEIGEMPPSQQGKLLTALEDREVRRVGGNVLRPLDVRLVSGTGKELAPALAAGSFRRDLFHRIAVLHHRIPPLRSRPEDAEQMAGRLARSLARRHGAGPVVLEPAAVAFVREYDWPGNVRELAHCLEAALILHGGPRLTAEALKSVVATGRAA